MKNFSKILGLIALVAIIGFSMTTCDNDSGTGGYFVGFDSNGGTPVAQMDNITSIATEPVSTRDGYTFDGWFINSRLSGSRVTFPYAVTANTTLYAKWTAAYTVSFITNSGSAVAQMDNVSSIATEPVSTRAGYTFGGWFIDSGLSGSRVTFPYAVTANTTLYAKWLSIGDTGPGSGIIFYHDPDGFTVQGYGNPGDAGYFATYTAYYLEVASGHASFSARWGAYGIATLDVTTFSSASDPLANAIGNGRKDTLTIVYYLEGKETDTAAQLCVRGSNDTDDWFLPSRGELDLLYNQRNLAGIGGGDGGYWSSSRNDNYGAWSLNFEVGEWYGSTNAATTSRVRAIRAF